MTKKAPISVRLAEPDAVQDISFADQFGHVAEDAKARARRELTEALRLGALGESHVGKPRPYVVELADGTRVTFS